MQQQQAGKGRELQRGVPARQSEPGEPRADPGEPWAEPGEPWADPGEPWTEPGEPWAVPAQLMNRILLENTREAVRQVTEAEIHEASACPECLQKEAELAKVAFLRHKKTLLEGALIQEKLEEHFYSRDVLTLLGEALRSLPQPSEDPRDLRQRLEGQEMESLN